MSEKSKPKTLADIDLDDHNANRGTTRGSDLLEKSIAKRGFGRPGMLDVNYKAVAGNKATIAAKKVFGENAEPIIIDSDGKRPVYVRRVDIDLNDPNPNNPAKVLAYEDNFIQVVSLDFDPDVILDDLDDDFDFSEIGMTDEELSEIIGNAGNIGDEDEFEEHDENVKTNHECPKCGYSWSS